MTLSVRVAVTTSTFAEDDPAPMELLADAGVELASSPHARRLEPQETIDLLRGCAGVIAGTETYDESVLAALPDLKVISRVGVGLDDIDLGAAAARGIVVTNTPGGPTAAVAELTIALMLDLLRHVSSMDRALRAGTWKKRMGNLLRGKRVGVVGYGRIGRSVAGLAQALGAEVAFCDVCEPSGDEPHPAMTLGSLLGWADIVTLHCPACEDGALIGAVELARMRRGSWIVNTSRGSLIDEVALVDALRSGHIAGAGVDVHPWEPYDGPLTELDNAVLTPHVGSYAIESRVEMETDAVRNLLEALRVLGLLP